MIQTYDFADDTLEITVKVTGFHKGRPERTWGAWEDCYPEEPEEIEFDVVSVVECSEDGSKNTLDKSFADEYLEELEQLLLDEIHSMERDYD